MSAQTRMRAARALTATLALAGLLIAAPTAVSASTPVPVSYDVTGQATIKAAHGRVTVPATTFTATSWANGRVVGDLPVPPTVAHFLAGDQPARVTITFVPVGHLVGAYYSVFGGLEGVTGSARYVMRLSDLVLDGQAFDVGPSCRTVTPVTMTASTPVGSSFDRVRGGTITGTFTIPGFTDCNKGAASIERTISGPGNRITLHLTGA